MKSVIGKVISETQSTFVNDRHTLDAILIANEVVDDAKKRKKFVSD
ncbi:cysteine-rich receptor-like protein kinase [Trifolium medium]|uniref:Cysteine-rich receptor-like protein kinase n=1 Tax=Trifolium medium TaxID=97028 RepID=A0A392U1L0_9FABA|nr:cysteine-rich receptor-like protein kinase [Trifolium medium]